MEHHCPSTKVILFLPNSPPKSIPPTSGPRASARAPSLVVVVVVVVVVLAFPFWKLASGLESPM